MDFMGNLALFQNLTVWAIYAVCGLSMESSMEFQFYLLLLELEVSLVKAFNFQNNLLSLVKQT